jgi:hypothetical protein
MKSVDKSKATKTFHIKILPFKKGYRLNPK